LPAPGLGRVEEELVRRIFSRRYTQVIWVDGEKHRAYGRACKQDDGSWQMEN
jgi:surface antigen